VSDGVVRIQFVAGEAALKYDDEEANVLNELKKAWNIELGKVVPTATKFFNGYKQTDKLLNMLQKDLLKDRI